MKLESGFPNAKIENSQNSPETENNFLEDISWDKVLDMANWNSAHRDAVKYSTEELKRREDTIYAYFSKIGVERLLLELDQNLKNVNDEEKLRILGLIPFDRLPLDSEQKKNIAQQAITLVTNYHGADQDRKNHMNAAAPSLVAVRSMAKAGILDYSQFLFPEDVQKTTEGLNSFYYGKNKAAMMVTLNNGVNKFSDSEFKKVNSFKGIEISNESKKQIAQHFGNENFGLKVQGNISSEGFDNGFSNLVMGSPLDDERLIDSMFPMNQRTATGFMPTSDFRLNFQFNEKNYDEMAKITADIMSYAQLKGIPITSKITSPDNPQLFQGRMLFYVDHNIAQLLVNYMKEKKYIFNKVSIGINDQKTYAQAGLSVDGAIVLRGTAEGANDIKKTQQSFNWIVNQEK